MQITDVKGNLHNKGVLKVLTQSQYTPTEEKLRLLADKYEADADIFVFACFNGETAVGIIAVKRLTAASFEILSIAVETASRGKGIGSKMISFVAERFSCSHICAETDDDAVGFYRKFGFGIESLGEKYPGVIRYLCTLEL